MSCCGRHRPGRHTPGPMAPRPPRPGHQAEHGFQYSAAQLVEQPGGGSAPSTQVSPRRASSERPRSRRSASTLPVTKSDRSSAPAARTASRAPATTSRRVKSTMRGTGKAASTSASVGMRSSSCPGAAPRPGRRRRPRRRRPHEPLQRLVVQDDDHTVAGEPEVELHPVGAQRHARTQRRRACSRGARSGRPGARWRWTLEASPARPRRCRPGPIVAHQVRQPPSQPGASLQSRAAARRCRATPSAGDAAPASPPAGARSAGAHGPVAVPAGHAAAQRAARRTIPRCAPAPRRPGTRRGGSDAGAAPPDRAAPRRASPGSAPRSVPRRCSATPWTDTAPAAAQASITSSSCSSESESPGSTGATRTPQGMPSSVSRRRASTRLSGGGVPGSVSCHTARSSVPMEKLTATSVRSAPRPRAGRRRAG